MLLGIRPSGWEKNSRPSYGKRISSIGIEYSEHSSYKELERFVRFLKPKRVISTVPVGRDLFVTGEVPTKWYKYEGTASMLSTGYQPSISTFLTTPRRRTDAPLVKSETEMILSPVEAVENAFDVPVPDCVTILSSGSGSEIVVRNEATPPETGLDSEVVDANDETLQADTSLLLSHEIDIKFEGLEPDSPTSHTKDETDCAPGTANNSPNSPGAEGGARNSEDQGKTTHSPAGAALASRLTSDASDDWLSYL